MQCRMQEHKRVGGDMVGNGGAEHGREGWDTADGSTLSGRSVEGGMGCEGSGENRVGLEVVSDSGAQERTGH